MAKPLPSNDNNNISALHQALVTKLKEEGAISNPRVEAAFRAVPRHLFLPGVELDKVYTDTFVVSKEQNGEAISSSSQPAIMAIMLELLDLRPGQRVLEIGAGTGFNAALIAHLVGNTGQVVTIDIDEDIVTNARAHLEAADFERVTVVCGDGGLGWSQAAPYDRIILTVAAPDIVPAWREQLKPGGRIVAPLELTRAESILGSKTLIAFDHINGCLESVAIRPCGFMRLRGAFATKPEGLIPLGPVPGLNLVVSTHVDADGLWTALNSLTSDDTTEARVTLRDVWGLRLWLALREPLFCDLYAEGDAARHRLVPFLVGQVDSFAATFGLCEGTTLCVLMRLPEQVPPPNQSVDLDETFDLMVRCFGPGKRLAQRLVAYIAAWNASGHSLTTGPAWTLEEHLRIRAYPDDTEYMPTVDEVVIDRQWTRLVCNWQ